MSLTKDILIILTSYSDGYRVMRRRMLGMEDYPKDIILRESRELKEATVRTILYRLKKNGLASSDDGIWRITNFGAKYLQKLVNKRNFIHNEKNTSTGVKRNMIIAFDIPEKLRFERNLIRNAIKNLGFEMLQKSVWLGPAPLPKKFIEWMRELSLIHYMKFFKAAEHEIV